MDPRITNPEEIDLWKRLNAKNLVPLLSLQPNPPEELNEEDGDDDEVKRCDWLNNGRELSW